MLFRSKNSVQKLLLFNYNKKTDQINCIRAHELKFADDYIYGKHVTLVNFIPGQTEDLNHMVLENQKKVVSRAQNLNHVLKRSSWRLSNDHLNLKLLLARLKDEKQKFASNPEGDLKAHKKGINQIFSEIIRRLCLGFALPSCTLMASAFAIQTQRIENKKNFYQLMILTFAFLVSFFLAKSLDSYFVISSTLYLLAQLMLVIPAILRLKKLARGEA